MHVTDPHIWRGGAYVFIALFSCLQILFGFFLITEDKPAATTPIVKVALYNDLEDQEPQFLKIAERQDIVTNDDNLTEAMATRLNQIMPTAGQTALAEKNTDTPAQIGEEDDESSLLETAKILSNLKSTPQNIPQYRPPLLAR